MKPQWVLQQSGQGSPRLVLRGSFVADDADPVASALRSAVAEHSRVEVDLSHCRGAVDLFVLRLLGLLRHDPRAPELAFSGLTRHQLRLMDYLGYSEMAAPAGG